MAIHRGRYLGLAVYEGVIRVAEVRDGGAVLNAGQFEFPEKVDYSVPEALGAALKEYLKAEGFKSRTAVIGLPAMWLMTKAHTVPPSDETTRAGVLRIQAERAFAYDPQDLAVDYIAHGHGATGDTVLLVASLQRRVDQLMRVAAEAGLKVTAITSSSTALAMAVPAGNGVGGAPGGAPGMSVQLLDNAAELAIHSSKGLGVVRHLSGDSVGEGDVVDQLTRELRRVIATEGDGHDDGCERLTVWDGVGLPDQSAQRIGEKLSLDFSKVGHLTELAKVNGEVGSGRGVGRFAAPIALGCAGSRRDLIAMDFLHSRLAPPKPKRVTQPVRTGGLVVLAVLAGAGWLYNEWSVKRADVAELQTLWELREPALERDSGIIDQINYADGWYGRRPDVLGCMLELSRAFPESGSIWLTNLTLRENMSGSVSGRSTSEDVVIETRDKMQAADAFGDVKLKGMREGGRDGREVTFEIGFQYQGEGE
ncbi:MAG: PilN domain-containing protein [Planctomycetota bacterium]|jgi:hypothetical protein